MKKNYLEPESYVKPTKKTWKEISRFSEKNLTKNVIVKNFQNNKIFIKYFQNIFFENSILFRSKEKDQIW